MLKRLSLGVLAFGLVGSTLSAGEKTVGPVVINKSAKSASASIGDARNLAPAGQYFYCFATYTTDTLIAACYASDGNGQSASCVTQDSGLAQTIRTINGDAAVTFNWTASGACSSITVSNGSMFSPKQP